MASNINSPNLDVNSPRSLFAAIYLSVIGASVFIVQPGFVQGMVEFYGFTEQQAGYIASTEIWGLALTTVLLAFGGHTLSWQSILKASLVLFMGGNLASLASDDLMVFGALRFLTGVGSGGLVALTFTIIGLTRLPDRNFGYLIMGVLVYGALGLWAMPTAFELIGIKGVIVFFALFGATGWFGLPYLPDSGEEHLQIEADAIDLDRRYRVLAIVAMFTYFFAQGVIWAYLFLIGLNGGLSGQSVANGLMLSQFMGIAGAFLAAMLGNRYGRIIPLAVGILGGAAILGILFGQFNRDSVCTYRLRLQLCLEYDSPLPACGHGKFR